MSFSAAGTARALPGKGLLGSCLTPTHSSCGSPLFSLVLSELGTVTPLLL